MKKQFTKLIGACCTLVLLLISISGAQAQYCIPGTSSVDAEWIAGVEFAGIDNQTPTAPASSYNDFTEITGLVAPGLSYEFVGTIGNGATWTETMAVWIDFNQDEIFDNVTERFNLPGSCNSNGCQLTTDILIPVDAIPGVTRMRVRQNFSSQVSDACATATFSETEDYSLLIGGDCTPPDFAYTITDDCELFTYNVTATLNDFGEDISGPNTFITIYLTRSDIGDAGFITIPDFLIGQTVDVISDVPFGVTVTASVEGNDPDCNSTRNWSEDGLCPPPGDLCADALQAECGETYDGSTVNASSVEGQEYCAGTTAPTATNGGVWYTFDLDATYAIDLDLSGSDYDTKMWLYSGSCDELTCIIGDDDGGDGLDSRIQGNYPAGTYYVYITGIGTARGNYVFNYTCEELICVAPILTATAVDDADAEIEGCLDFGTTHRVMITLADGFNNDTYSVTVGDSTFTMVSPGSHIFGDYIVGTTISISVGGDQDPLCDQTSSISVPICPPSNDLCTEAFEAECGGGPYLGSTIGATSDSDQEFCAGTTPPSATNGGVWYVFTLDGTYDVDVDLSGSDFDTKLWIYSGSCDELTCILGNDDGGDGLDSRIQGTYPAGTYYAYVTGIGTSRGDYVLNISCEELPCNAPAVTVVAVDDEGVEIDGCLPFGETHRVSVELAGGEGNDTYLVTVGDSTFVMASPDSHIFGDYTVGSNVSIAVNGDTEGACDLTSTVSVPICPAENDLCVDAVEAVCGQNYGGTTVGATSDPSQVYCGTAAPTSTNGGVWYTFTVAGETEIDIDLSGSDYDTKLWLYSGTCDELTCIDGDDDGGDGFDSRIEATVQAGTYYAYVSGIGTAQGNYVLSFSCLDVSCSPEVSATAVDINGDELTECVDQTGEYYVMVAVTGGANNDFYNITINGDDFGQVAAEGSVVVGPIAATSVANVSVTGDEQITCSGIASTSVVLCPPSNDLCEDAIAVECGDVVGGNTDSATGVGYPEGFCGTTPNAFGVWYSYTGTGVETTFSLCGSDYDTKLNIYSGTCGELTCVAGNDDNFTVCGAGNNSHIADVEAIDGVEYYILVSGFSTATGNFNLSIICSEEPDCEGTPGGLVGPGDACSLDGEAGIYNTDCDCILTPANDLCEDAPIVECGDIVEGTIVAASGIESPTAFCGTTPGSAGVWYSYVGTGVETTFSLCGSGYDTKLNVYTGTCDEFVCEGGNDDNFTACGSGGASQLNVEALDGVVYSIYVSGFGTATGDFTLTVTCSEVPDCEGTPGGLVGPGSPCIEDGAAGIFDDDCECIPTPANDLCENAIAISCGDVMEGNTDSASTIGNPTAFCGTTPTAAGVWYTFVGNGTETTVSLCGSSYDTKLNIYTGTCDALVCETGNDDNFAACGAGNNSHIVFTPENGVEYTILVNGFSSQTGDFVLSLSCENATQASIDGSVIWPTTCGDRDVTVDVYTPDTEDLIGTYDGVVDMNGTFTIDGLPLGTYDVIARVEGALAVGFADYVISAGANALDLGAVLRGDTNGDNKINIIDVSNITAAFNSSEGDANFNPLADLNCSGGVNIADVSIFTPSFGISGAEAPLE